MDSSGLVSRLFPLRLNLGTRMLWVAMLVCLIAVPQLFSHQGALAFWTVEVQQQSCVSNISISLLDLHFLETLDENHDSVLEYEEVMRNQEVITTRVMENFEIRNDGRDASVEVKSFKVLQTGMLELEVQHQFSDGLTELQLKSTFYEITDLNHRVFCKVDYKGEVQQYYFDSNTQLHDIEIRKTWKSTIRQIGNFIWLGVEHIFTGYDHLAFLLGLTLLGGSVRQLIGIVSSFTIAHSITLSLSTLDVLVLPTRFVESAIALSIFYIAMENIFLSEAKDRWKISFFFGLIHGFGFSNILREMHLPRSGLFASLFSFNLGVEIGQVVIIALVFPLIVIAHRQTWRRSMITVTSIVLGILSVIWFIERIV